MREFLAIVGSFSVGLFVTAALAFSLEYRQLANLRSDTNADVRPGIVSLSGSGYALKVLDRPLLAQPPQPPARNAAKEI